MDDDLLVAVNVDATISVWKMGAKTEEGASLSDSASATAPSSSAGNHAVTSTAICGRD